MSRHHTPFARRNYVLGIALGAMMNAGMAFIDPVTVLPLFVTRLGGSPMLVGLVSALHGVAWFLPQVFASRFAATRARLMPMYRLMSIIRSGAILGLAWAVLAMDPANPTHILIVFVFLLFITHLAGGVAAVPFLEVTSKSIPVQRRGRFFGMRRLIGGVLGVLAGMIIGLVLDQSANRPWMYGPMFDALARVVEAVGILGRSFPDDFGVLFLLGAVCMSAGMLVFGFAGERPSAPSGERIGAFDHIRRGFRLLKKDRHYRRFYWLRICWQLTAMSFPFYTMYAFTRLQMSDSTVGLFVSVLVGAGVIANPFWGRLLDRHGNRLVLLVTAALSAIPPAVVLAVDPFTDGRAPGMLVIPVLFTAAFAVNGFVRSGRIISNMTYLLEFAPEDKRPLYVGFMNSFTFPLMLSPLIGGVIFTLLGLRVLFALSLLFALWNVVLTLGLREPRLPVTTS